MKQVVDDQGTLRTKKILFDAGYRHQWSVNVPDKKSCLTAWIGKRGVVIVQSWPDGAGCTCFADWPLGSSYEQFEAAIA